MNQSVDVVKVPKSRRHNEQVQPEQPPLKKAPSTEDKGYQPLRGPIKNIFQKHEEEKKPSNEGQQDNYSRMVDHF